MEGSFDTLILGIGNLLWADEGFGVRCAEVLHERYILPPGVRVMDGGTQGLYLLPYVEAAQRLLVFDAIDFQLPVGTLCLIEGDDVPRFMGAKKMSLHQTGFQEVLAAAALVGRCPRELALIGCQPVELDDFGGSLRAEVKARITPALDLACDWLAARGIRLEARQAAADAEPLTAAGLGLDAYEAGRPSAEQACRSGDERFFPSEAG